jgi:DNA mismatch repair protein MSH4
MADILTDDLKISATLKYDDKRKYWLRLRAVDFEDRVLPDCLVNVTRSSGFIQCTTLDLKKLNQKVVDAAVDALIWSDQVVEQLLDEIRLQVQSLFRICDSIALLDMIASFGHVVTLREYIRPLITSTLALKAARHPVLDKVNAISRMC